MSGSKNPETRRVARRRQKTAKKARDRANRIIRAALISAGFAPGRELRHPRPTRRGPDRVGREPFPHKFWRLFAAQHGRCYLCPDAFTDEDWATYDHVKPRGRGHGLAANTLLSHSQCNARKGAAPPYPCELVFLEAVNLKLPRSDLHGHVPPIFVPLRQRLAAFVPA